MARLGRCSCGQLTIECEGEPVRTSICHCLECQMRTGSVFGAQVRFDQGHARPAGRARQFTRRADSGSEVTFSFCPDCGSTVHWTLAAQPGVVVVALGAFAEPGFGAPAHSVYERHKHSWVDVEGIVDRLD